LGSVYDTEKDGLRKKASPEINRSGFSPYNYLFDGKKNVLRPKNGLVFKLTP